MNHDPSCPKWFTKINEDTWHFLQDDNSCRICDLIKIIRFDESNKAADRIKEIRHRWNFANMAKTWRNGFDTAIDESIVAARGEES